MAIQLPAAGDKQNSPDHSLSHRVFANDNASPEQSVVVDASGVTKLGSDLVLPKTQGNGIRVDTTSPTFPWHDIIGDVSPDPAGGTAPLRIEYYSGVYGYRFILSDECDFTFHIPHDYLMGSNLFWHLHWSHNGTAVSGVFTATCRVTYSKGHNQELFRAPITTTISYDTVNIATTPQYRHRVDEVQLSASSPSGSQIDTDDIEPDGLVLISLEVTSLPTVTGGNLFIHTGDLHYQSTNIGTKNKVPGFYS